MDGYTGWFLYITKLGLVHTYVHGSFLTLWGTYFVIKCPYMLLKLDWQQNLKRSHAMKQNIKLKINADSPWKKTH